MRWQQWLLQNISNIKQNCCCLSANDKVKGLRYPNVTNYIIQTANNNWQNGRKEKHVVLWLF